MRSLVFLPVAAVAVQVLETQQPAHAHVDYDGLRVTLKGIAEKSKTGKIDEATTENVRQILNTVENDLMAALDVDRNNSQTLYNNALQMIQDCDDTRNGFFDASHGGIATFEEATNSARSAHTSCRDAERQLCIKRNNDCDAQDGRVASINQNMCPTPNFSAGDSASVNDFMNCITGLVCDNYESYTAGRTLCRNECSNLVACTADCHEKQLAFEVATCNELGAIQTHCSNYRDCRVREERNYYQTKSTVESEESLFQAQRVALECLMCYGRAILNEMQDFAECDSPPPCLDLDNCPTINYPPFVPFQQCSEVPSTKPCEDDWCDDEYTGVTLPNSGITANFLTGEISRHVCVPATDSCLTCSAPRVGEEGDESGHTSSGFVPSH